MLSPRILLPINPRRASVKRLRAGVTRAVASFLAAEAYDMARQINAARAALGKASDPNVEIKLARVLAELNFSGWAVLVGEVGDWLTRIFKDGADAAFAQIGINTEARKEVVNVVSAQSVAYGEQRAAAMVGMRVDALGTIIPNPRAEWRITEGTREYLRADVRDAIAQGWSNEKLAQKIRDSYGFSESRAMVIARTETNLASNRGALESYKASGVVHTKEWLTAEDDKVSEDCLLNGEAGPIALDGVFPSGASAPPDHPNCRCTLIPGVDWTKLDNLNSALEIQP